MRAAVASMCLYVCVSGGGSRGFGIMREPRTLSVMGDLGHSFACMCGGEFGVVRASGAMFVCKGDLGILRQLNALC